MEKHVRRLAGQLVIVGQHTLIALFQTACQLRPDGLLALFLHFIARSKHLARRVFRDEMVHQLKMTVFPNIVAVKQADVFGTQLLCFGYAMIACCRHALVGLVEQMNALVGETACHLHAVVGRTVVYYHHAEVGEALCQHRAERVADVSLLII